MTYSEKLKDPRWQRKRLKILERDNFTCQYCRSKDNTLHVHHKIYRKSKMPWDYEDEVFVTLCEDCHDKAEQTKNLILLKLGRNENFDDSVFAIAESMFPRPKTSHLTYLGWIAEKLVEIIHLQSTIVRDGNEPNDGMGYYVGIEIFSEMQESITEAQKNFKSICQAKEAKCENELLGDPMSRFDRLIESAPDGGDA